ncbi:tyrosine kinase catalytic domain protein, partial [Rhizoctonia solani 123E]
MTDTLRGLSYMHGFKSGAIAHGDIKLSNILVTANETALICDFGRSRQPHDKPNEIIVSNSSPFVGTVRYMSPELFVPNAARPSPAADMWAYGCIALESGDVPSSPVPADMFPRVVSGPMPSWPSELDDLNDLLGEKSQMASSVRSTVWMTTLSSPEANHIVVIKVPRLNASIQNQARHDHLRYILRKVVTDRAGVRHPNIINLLGIASGFSPHEGLVFEYCSHRNLVVYFKENWVRQTEYARPPAPEVNAYSLMCDILEGLKYMHGYPVPIPQGDLTPENILVGFDGRAKINLFSFGRLLASLPSAAGVTASIGSVLAFRWLSPELLKDSQGPTTESDMWTVGCTFYWILTGLEPYTSHRRDDFAGAESVRGRPPGTLANVDYSRAWITNGIWGTIGRCWRRDPLLRTSAGGFLRILQDLEGRKISWLPLNVTDLTGKVKFHPRKSDPEHQIATYTSTWKRFRYGGHELEENVQLKMTMYRATYTPKWYSKSTPVAIKVGYDFSELDQQALITSIQREITLMAQVDHPRIQKLLGIDSSNMHIPDMVFEFDSQTTFDMVLSQGKGATHKHVQILRDLVTAIVYLHEHENGSIAHGDIQPANILVLPDGTAKLGNFTCSFQYLSGQPTSPEILSTTVSTPERSPLYCDPNYYQQSGGSRLVVPTLAGDIWSFGTVVLS